MLLTIPDYAKKCGYTSSYPVRNLIKQGLLQVTKIPLPDTTTGEYIDTDIYPPKRQRNPGGGRKKKNI